MVAETSRTIYFSASVNLFDPFHQHFLKVQTCFDQFFHLRRVGISASTTTLALVILGTRNEK